MVTTNQDGDEDGFESLSVEGNQISQSRSEGQRKDTFTESQTEGASKKSQTTKYGIRSAERRTNSPESLR